LKELTDKRASEEIHISKGNANSNGAASFQKQPLTTHAFEQCQKAHMAMIVNHNQVHKSLDYEHLAGQKVQKIENFAQDTSN
jgi:hypothetical protein